MDASLLAFFELERDVGLEVVLFDLVRQTLVQLTRDQRLQQARELVWITVSFQLCYTTSNLCERLLAVLPHELGHLLSPHQHRPHHQLVEGIPETTDLVASFGRHLDRNFRWATVSSVQQVM